MRKIVTTVIIAATKNKWKKEQTIKTKRVFKEWKVWIVWGLWLCLFWKWKRTDETKEQREERKKQQKPYDELYFDHADCSEAIKRIERWTIVEYRPHTKITHERKRKRETESERAEKKRTQIRIWYLIFVLLCCFERMTFYSICYRTLASDRYNNKKACQ